MLSAYTYLRSWLAVRLDDRGASLVEYALLVVLIAIFAIVAIRMTGTAVSSTFSNIGSELQNP